MISISVTCPQRIQIENRQARNRKREKSPAVKAKIAAWVIGKLCSCGCKRPANMAHHPKGELYETDEAYLNLNECEPYYSSCHHNMHKGLVRCPTCTGWMRPGNDKCFKCQGWRRQNCKKGLLRHPCDHNTGQQQCRRDGQLLVCGRSPKKAEGCDYFKKREAVHG